MIFLEFPITGALRELLLCLEWVFIFLSLELGAIFLIRYKTKQKEARNIQEISYAAIFLSISLAWFFIFILGDYYVEGEKMRYIMLNCGYFTQMTGTLIFLYFIEKSRIFFKKNLFSILFVLLLVFYIFIFTVDMIYDFKLGQIISYLVIWPLFFLCLFIYIYEIAKNLPDKTKFKITTLKFLFGLPLLISGLLLVSDNAIVAFGLEIRILGDILQLMGILIFFLLFSTIPPFCEFDWYDKIDGVFLINESGLRLYDKIFPSGKSFMNSDMIAGALTSVKLMLEELTSSKGISIIKKKENIIIFYPGKYITGVIFCREELNSLKILLQRFIIKVETIYENILLKWVGDLTVFRPVENICNEVFSK
jgi:hypothetical protein